MQKIVLVMVLALLPLFGSAKERIEVWTYHLSPPFIVDDRHGLSHDFVDWLNQHPLNDQRFLFELITLPRKRIDIHLAKGRPGVLLWATPSFFTAASTRHAKWSAPLLMDQQDFVSLPDAPFDYLTPESLHGRTLGGVLGHRYEGLEADIARKKIERQDVRTDLQNIEKLLSGRIHTLLISRSTLFYYSKQHDFGDLYISARPLYRFSRHVLLTDSLGDAVTLYLNEVLEQLPDDPQWQVLLHRYGLMPMAPQQ